MSITAAPAAKDNLLGICHAIGEDFGFNPFLLRAALAIAIIFAPLWTLGAYAAMGVAVAASRLLIRRKKAPKLVVDQVEAPAAELVTEEEFALAA